MYITTRDKLTHGTFRKLSSFQHIVTGKSPVAFDENKLTKNDNLVPKDNLRSTYSISVGGEQTIFAGL